MQRAIAEGKKITETLFRTGCNAIGLGEMGIGNTSSAALIMSFVTGTPIEECVGRGTGTDDDQLERKIATLRQAYGLHLHAIARSPQASTILQHVGGFEIAMMVGACLKAAELHMVIVVDGFITTAAVLLAQAMDQAVLNHCSLAHTSGERGHQKMLQHLGFRPPLDLGMRLGEGSGAAMAFASSSVRLSLSWRKMESFESAGVSNSRISLDLKIDIDWRRRTRHRSQTLHVGERIKDLFYCAHVFHPDTGSGLHRSQPGLSSEGAKIFSADRSPRRPCLFDRLSSLSPAIPLPISASSLCMITGLLLTGASSRRRFCGRLSMASA